MKYILADPHGKPFSKRQVAQFLARPNLLRIAYLDETGEPVAHPVWYYFSKGRFLVAVDARGSKARALRRNPQVYFLVDESPKGAPPCGVRGKGTARVVDDPAYATKITKISVKKYLGTLESKIAKKILEMGPGSSVVEITPRYFATWKF